MGRKIPGKKHRGVKDPEKQKRQRFLKIKDKINAPPKNVDDQPIPKSVLRIAELKKKAENGTGIVKKKNIVRKRSTKKGRGLVKVHVKVREGEKPIPKFEQKIGESNNAFLYRVNQICESVQREAAFEKKYGVDVKRDPVTGKVQGIMKRQKDPLELIVQSVKKEKKKTKLQKKKKKDSNTEEMIKLSKSQKRQIKLKEKKKRKETNNEKEFEGFSDTIKFGEITHAPPNLVTPRMIAKNNEKPRPGQKQLLLKSIINKTGSETNIEEPVGKSDIYRKGVNHKVIDKKGKRKDLPNALRRQLDKQQKEIIDVYKSIKAQKRIKS